MSDGIAEPLLRVTISVPDGEAERRARLSAKRKRERLLPFSLFGSLCAEARSGGAPGGTCEERVRRATE